MLSEKEKHEILEEAKQYPYLKAVCLDALKIVQKHRGWVSDEAVREVSDFIGAPAEEVEGVATFYSRIYRYPVGRHVILLCDSLSCMIMGYERLYDHLVNKLGIRFGETTPDGRFTLLPISCLGDCDHAPSLMIDDELYHELTIQKIDELLEKYQ
ncbi:MAG TPA: NADH-quinone oxidoreductase subunit NuoE [Bacteroidales bacterium]|nr:NADH-quinone oxidoreductase subunit NuoE [Bacteroidales bacterium]